MKNKKTKGKKSRVRWELIKLIIFCVLYLLFLIINRGIIYGKKALVWYFIRYMVYILLGIALLIYLYKNNNYKDKYVMVNKIINKVFSLLVIVVIVLFVRNSFSIFCNFFKDSKSIVTDNYYVSYSIGRKHRKNYYLYIDNIDDGFYISSSLYNRLLDSDKKIEVWYWEDTSIIDKIEFVD